MTRTPGNDGRSTLAPDPEATLATGHPVPPDGGTGRGAPASAADYARLEARLAEVEAARDDLSNLLTSTKIALVLLDTDLVIRRFTPAMAETMRILDSDIGRPIADIAMRAPDAGLLAGARRCLQTQTESEAEVETDTGQVLIRRLRPYRTGDGGIGGVVVTYTDISNLHRVRVRARLRERQQEAVSRLGREALSGASPDTLFAMAAESTAQHMNTRFVKILQIDPDPTTLTLRGAVGWNANAVVGQTRVESGVGSQAGYTLLRATPVVVEDFRTETRFKPPRFLSEHGILCGASVIIGPLSAPWGVLGAHETDIGRCEFSQDDLNFLQGVANVLWLAIASHTAARDLTRERAQLRDLTDSLPIRFAVIDRDERYEFVNRAYESSGHSRDEIEGMTVRRVLGEESYAIARAHILGALAGEPQEYEMAMYPADDAQGHALVRYVPRVEEGVVTGFYSAVIDITRQREAERESLERLGHYKAVGDTVPFGVWTADTRGGLTYASQSFLDMTGLDFEAARGFGWLDALQEDTREATRRAWIASFEAGAPWEREQRFIDRDGRLRHVLAIGRPVQDERGAVTSWAGFNLDITRRKDQEERVALISAELDHRVKNILATVTTIARMTSRSCATLEDYRTALDQRLQAMANAHQVLAESGWRGMALRELLTKELAPYLALDTTQVTLSGPDVQLQPGPTQTLALAFHELTTNAAKYGALSRDGGRLAISWGWNPGDDRGVLLTWTESGMTGIEEPASSGFGTLMLERVLTAQYASKVAIDFRPEGLAASILLPEALMRL